jgi:hypothetical protein
VPVDVTVSNDGSIDKGQVVSGHPLLVGGVEQIVKRWKLQPQPGDNRSFRLKCEFELPDMVVRDAVEVTGLLHLILMAPLPPALLSATSGSNVVQKSPERSPEVN